MASLSFDMMPQIGWNCRRCGWTTSGGTAWEVQLIRAFSNGGLRYAEIAAPATVAEVTSPAGAQAAFQRSETLRRETRGHSKVRVDLGANTPCPT